MNCGERHVPLDCGLGSSCSSYRKAETLKKTLHPAHSQPNKESPRFRALLQSHQKEKSVPPLGRNEGGGERWVCASSPVPQRGQRFLFCGLTRMPEGRKGCPNTGPGVLSEILEARSWLLVDSLCLFLLPRQKASGHLHPCVCMESLQLSAAATHTRTSQSPFEN